MAQQFGLSEFFESKARGNKTHVSEGYGYEADVGLGVGFYVECRNMVKVLEDPVNVPNGTALVQGYVVVYAYCTKDGIISMLNGQMPPTLPCTKKEPAEFGSLAAIADNFGSKNTSAKMDHCVAFRMPAHLATQVEGAGVGNRDIWIARFDQDVVSPLLEAAKMGDATKVTKMLDSGLVDANAMDEQQVSALMMAAVGGHTDVCKVLLSKGAKANHAEAMTNKTALMFAAQGGHTSTVEVLLAAKADASLADSEGSTPLMWAAVANKPDVAALLRGSRDVKNVQGQTAFALAEKLGHKDAIAVLAH